MRCSRHLALVCGLAAATFATSARAAEIFVAPSGKVASSLIGDWGVAHPGDTRLSFGVPENMQQFTSAKLVIIGKNSDNLTYDLHLSISRDLLPHNNTTDAILDLPLSVTTNVLQEIDVTTILARNTLVPGVDAVTLNFLARPGTNVLVVGLRFVYVGPAGPTGSAGPVGATGVQGIAGVTGPQGVQGPLGPQGTTGTTGAVGPQGLTGTPGAQGIQGPIGATGEIGPQGLTGSTGSQGQTGDTGSQGIRGNTGPQGNIGPIGPQGPQGVPGAKGDTGPAGPQGPPGSGSASYNPMQVAQLKWSANTTLSFPTGAVAPYGIAFDGANMWVVNMTGGYVTKLRASDGVNLGTFPVGGTGPRGMAFDGAYIWTANESCRGCLGTVTKM